MTVNKHLRIINVNARSVANKTEQLEILLLQHDPHVAVITETWLHSEITDDLIFPPSYKVFRKDRPSRGGGVAVLIKNNIQAVSLEDVPDLECLCMKLFCWGHCFILYAVYRPPNVTQDYLTNLQVHMSNYKKSKILLFGDFNLPGVDWERLQPCSGYKKNVDIVFDIMFTHNLCQVVREPTREFRMSNSVLDLAFVPHVFHDCNVSVAPGLSDHHLVSVFIPIKPLAKTKTCKAHRIMDFTRADDASVIEHLETCIVEFDGTDACALWNQFKKMCHYCLINFIPVKYKNIRKQTPWMTRSIIHLRRRIKRLKKHRAQQSTINHLRENLALAVRRSKDYYFKTTLPNFIKNDPGKFWRHISDKKAPISEMTINGTTVTNQPAIAHHFNNYFHSVFSKPKPYDAPSTTSAHPSEVNFISYDGVVSMLLNLKTKSSPGPDDIPNGFLRRYAESLARFLVIIFRASLLTGCVPEDWKIARVVPVFKKGDRLQVTNYRPISLTSSCCKLMEHIVATSINEFLDRNNILTDYQHGFRKGFSTVTQLLSVIHSFAASLDNNSQIDAIFLDFSKAFDKVPHHSLILKLKTIGLPPIFISWINDYLTNRSQHVSIGRHQSGCLPVTSGVPQGSVLGPLLFLIYINDIIGEVCTGVHIRLYADDCVLFRDVSNENDQSDLQNTLTNIVQWCKRWDMTLNADKSVSLRITNKINALQYAYKLESSPLQQVASVKYLGVTLTNNLSWNSHIDNICSLAFRKLCYIRHKLRNAPANVKLLGYNTLIRPKLEYACIIWDPYTKSNIRKLENVQRKAIRFIYSKYLPTDSPSDLMHANGIEELQVRRRNFRLDFLSLLLNNKLRLDPSAYLSPMPTRNTRHYHKALLKPYFARTNSFKFSFFPRTISDWNSLTEPNQP